MSHAEYGEYTAALDDFIGPSDPSDPRTKKRMRILSAATEMFIRQGYRKTSVEQIAERAGVAKGTVYLYFKNKTRLALAAVALEERHFVRRIKPVLTDDMPPRDRLKRWLETVLVVVNDMPLMSRLLGGDHELAGIMAEMPPELRRKTDEINMRLLGPLVDEAAAPHQLSAMELEDRVRVLFGLSFFAGTLQDEAVRGGLPLERFASILSELVVDGLGPRNSVETERS